MRIRRDGSRLLLWGAGPAGPAVKELWIIADQKQVGQGLGEMGYYETMRVLLVNNGTRYLTPLLDLLVEHEVTVADFRRLRSIEASAYDLIVLSGGHLFTAITHRAVYRRELELIRTTSRPVIGVCLGFELIVLAFGGQLKLLRHAVHDAVTVTFAHQGPLTGHRLEYEVFENHRRAVKELPRELRALARSHYGVEVIKHEKRPVYGFQFHPEMSAAGEGRVLIERAIKALTPRAQTEA
jgi:GMP synthase-like glutamine amidotransferase